jgi:feruloyl esterase
MGPLVGMYFAWLAKVNANPDGSGVLTFNKLPALHTAVLGACDGLDGVVDGQVDDPRACHFDPAAIQCADGVDQDACLTAAQVTVARQLYEGPKDAQGRRLYPGWESYGSELAWEGSSVPSRQGGFTIAQLPDNYLRYVGYPIGAPHSSLADIEFNVAELNRLTPEGRKGNALSLDLREFRRAGGKLILWHGAYDQSIPFVGTVDYYERLAQRNGGLRQTQEWARLFVVPTKYHCELSGERLADFNPLPNLVSWVERARAPERIVATGTGPQGTPRERPVFPYPLQARYGGSGSVDDASNFVPVRPTGGPSIIDWAGSYLYDVPGPVAR